LVTALSNLMTLTVELLQNVSRGTDNLPANFAISVIFFVQL